MNKSTILKPFLTNLGKNVANYSQNTDKMGQNWREVLIKVPWGHLSGKWWNSTEIQPILTLHGWQDNCGSFNRLIPLLDPKRSYLAIDLPGHGLSSKLPPGMYYHSPNYVILVRFLAKYFNWEKVTLMGHSLGAITSYMYGMIYPQDVNMCICLDAFKPMVTENNNIHMARKIDQFLKYSKYAQSKAEPPLYTIQEIKSKISKPHKHSIEYKFAHHIMERNTEPSKYEPDKFYFSRDVRLKSGGLLNMAQDEILEYTKSIEFPILITKSTKASYYEPKENFYEVLDLLKKSNDKCVFRYVEGTHHVHLNNPEVIAPLIDDFMLKYGDFSQITDRINEAKTQSDK